MAIGIPVLFLCCCLCFYFLVNVIKLLKQVWWTPIRIQSNFRSQGVKGPPYKLFHGNTKEITDMRNRIMNGPMELSHNMLARILPHVNSWTEKYGPNFLNWYGTQAQLVITEPELVQQVLANKSRSYEKKSVQGYFDKLLGDGLVASQGEKWLKMRRLANYAFHGESLKGMIPAMIESVELMLKNWRQDKAVEIDVFSEFKVLTSEIISRAAFGSSYLEGKSFFDLLERMASIIVRNNYKVGIPGIRFIKSRDDIESEELEQGLRKSIMKLVRKREYQEPSIAHGNDFLGQLLKAHNERKISINDLIDECKTFYVAGHDTTASSLSWTVLLLATHPIWQDKAREEVFQLLGKQNPTPDNIGRLKILSMIINESLRLYPSIVNMTWEVQKEVRLGNLKVPEKMSVSLPVVAVHNNPQIWGPDVHSFKPERFSDGVTSAGFLPFGLGPRICVGLNFATAEMKIVLAMIMQHYRFTLSPTYRHSPVHRLTLCPQYGVQVRLEAL